MKHISTYLNEAVSKGRRGSKRFMMPNERLDQLTLDQMLNLLESHWLWTKMNLNKSSNYSVNNSTMERDHDWGRLFNYIEEQEGKGSYVYAQFPRADKLVLVHVPDKGRPVAVELTYRSDGDHVMAARVISTESVKTMAGDGYIACQMKDSTYENALATLEEFLSGNTEFTYWYQK